MALHRSWRTGLAWALVALATILLLVAYALPTVTYTRVAAADETYSIYGGIEVLWDDGNWFLASIVFAFSMVFPIAKLVALVALLVARLGPASRARVLGWTAVLGKWSMLDVFVIGAFVGSIQLGIARAMSRAGIHVFCAAIVVSMFATGAALRAELAPHEHKVTDGPLRWRAARLSVAVLAAGALFVALREPLFVVRKAIFMVNEVALTHTTQALWKGAEYGLAAYIGAWVIGLAGAQLVLSTWLAARARSGARMRRTALVVGEWSMIGVFALALAIVQVKLAELAQVTLHTGFWATFSAAALVELDAWLLRRTLRKSRH